ncbi:MULTISPECIES: family 20 glycosylhydrolase [Paraburkholderia]|uniref:family 20 glycosylhydrolase n=1 Tax=Paraburkholderia TaxID=1822464 RepID=UPI002258A2A3|nr:MULTISPECIES: family 20 glycosylhydrolase [Paraburkholderia]
MSSTKQSLSIACLAVLLLVSGRAKALPLSATLPVSGVPAGYVTSEPEAAFACSSVETNGSVAARGNNPAPEVVPALQTWIGGTGTWSLTATSRIVVETKFSAALVSVAQQLQRDIALITHARFVPKLIIGNRAGRNDIALSLTACNAQVASQIGVEGNTLSINDPTGVGAVLRAKTPLGILHATRTLLQMLSLDGTLHQSAPGGYAIDYPRYAVRSVMLDVGRLYMDKKFIEDYIKFMSWYKLNTLELHLNDQSIPSTVSDPLQAILSYVDGVGIQSALRVISDKPKFNKLRPTDGDPTSTDSNLLKGYQRADWDELENYAVRYGVEIKPEIDVPSHSGIFLNDRPDLAIPLTPRASWGGMMDAANPGTLPYVKTVFAEFLPWFRSASISVGGDEATFPQHTLEFDANVARGQLLNSLTDYLKGTKNAAGQNRVVTMWNDAYDPTTAISANRNDIVIQDWSGNDDAYISGDKIPNVLNSSQTWYVVPTASSGTSISTAASMYTGWSASKSVIGGQICDWNDNAQVISQDIVHLALKDMIPAAAQVFWSGTVSDPSGNTVPYSAVGANLNTLGYGPGTDDMGPDGSIELKGSLETPPSTGQ